MGAGLCSPGPGVRRAPVIGVDLGGNRSWSACSAVFPNGRIESWAIAPGAPSLAAQERDDQVTEGTYTELVKAGGLTGTLAEPYPE